MNDGVDELGLPTHIREDNREVDGKETSHEHVINLKEMEAEIDKVRIVFRSGVEFIFNEVWYNQIITMAVKNEKGQRPFGVLDPNASSFNAFKVQAPTDIF
jgi:hypothetical protein